MSESLTDSSEVDSRLVRQSKRKRDVDEETVHNGTVEFELSSVVEHVTCTLCSGMFKDPLTITSCLHSFCRSCLYSYFANTGKKLCPKCLHSLEPDPYKVAMRDRTLESLCEKVLFVDVKEQDDIQEKEFYARRGIPQSLSLNET